LAVKKFASPAAVAMVLTAFAVLPAGAQSLRTFVSALGNDGSANCASTAPCRTFAGALAKTSPGGEMTVLDSGEFGPLTINKSVSIIAEGVEAGIQVSSSVAIFVSVGASDVVVLRGLMIDGLATGVAGISFAAGGALHVQKCVIRNFRGPPPPTSVFGSGISQGSVANELYVSDTLVAANDFGILVNGSTSASPKAVIDRVQVENNLEGISVRRGANVHVRDSMVAGTQGGGFFATDNNQAATRLVIERSAAINNGTGILSAVSSLMTVILTDSTVTGNGTGLSVFGGVIASFGNNRIAGNGTDGAPTTTIAPR
jgi:hypothetical protein